MEEKRDVIDELFNIRALLEIIFRITGITANKFAIDYLMKDPAVIARWKSGRILPRISDIVEIVRVVSMNSSECQKIEIRREIEDLIKGSTLYNEFRDAILGKEDFSEFLLEALSAYITIMRRPSVPFEVAKLGPSATGNYFDSLKKGESRNLCEAKLIIVGQGKVGKTSLARKLTDNFYIVNPNETATEGIEIHNWVWDYTGRKYKVNIWDFGGQEIYHATHQFFLTKRSLYILVWDARTYCDFSSFTYWLNIISLFSDNSPILIVLNKTDEGITEINQAALKKKYFNIVGFYQISCLNGNGIDELSRLVKDTIVSLPYIETELSDAWINIRLKIEYDNRNYIDSKEYYRICKRYGLDEQKANYLSSYLHELGVILHFKDNYILKDTVILKPNWVTNAAYKVINENKIKENKGKFEIKDLDLIWGDNKYPTYKQKELLELMIKFEICFKLEDSDEYIVPELLPASYDGEKLKKENDLIREYCYDFLPSGIITRFIARNHELIENNSYWRNGVILYYNRARAFIESNFIEGKIKVAIEGENKKELLVIIKREFEHIHRTLNNPTVKEMIPCICDTCKSGNPEFYSIDKLEKYIALGKKTIDCPRSYSTVSVEALLSGAVKTTPNIFISYSHKDSKWLKRLQTHLEPYIMNSDFTIWDDTKIDAGDKWFIEIKNALESAKVGVLLVSPEFLKSQFINNHELAPLLKRAKDRGVNILWIAVSSSSYDITALADYQCANNPERPLDMLSSAHQNAEWVRICKKIMKQLGIQD